VKLFIVRRDQSLTEADVMAYCKERLTGYKRPRMIEFRTDLPKSNVGKILRRELRDGTAYSEVSKSLRIDRDAEAFFRSSPTQSSQGKHEKKAPEGAFQ
jgi:hypothetical protein